MTGTYSQERRGINAVSNRIAQLNQIWRETSHGDFGIDGHIENLTDDEIPTGLLVGVQVKTGPSYLRTKTEAGFSYSISEKHQHYWEHYPVPVLLILHDPDESQSYWVDVRQAIRSGSITGKTVSVPHTQILETSNVDHVFANAGVNPTEYAKTPIELLKTLTQVRTNNANFDISYFDLFCLGMTNSCRSLYFSMDLAMKIAERKLLVSGSEYGLGIGYDEDQFLVGYIRFLISQNLVHANYSDLLIDLDDRMLMPTFIAPLSKRGKKLKDYISAFEDSCVGDSDLLESGYRAAQDAFVEIVEMSMVHRFSRVNQVENLIRKSYL